MKLSKVNGLLVLIVCATSLLTVFQFNSFEDVQITVAEVTVDPIKSQHMAINVSKNVSVIGPNSIIQFSVNLKNTLSESLYNVTANLDANYSDLIITPDSNPLCNLSSIDPDTSTNFDFTIDYSEGNFTGSSIDVILIIDASGSMGDEINSVKQELNNLTATLQAEIPDLRIGVIVYGWIEYSEYPWSSPNNYIQFTNDFDSVKSFINSLYASGFKEPWGDALFIASTWDWRENAGKLIIMIGDEDCDPGRIIGIGESGDVYNGSELVDIVATLDNLGVVINTVVCEGANAMAENQFQWIASYTGGTSIYLPDLENEGINLPQIIQEWTIEMGREYYREINLTVLWQDSTGTQYFNFQSSSFWLDFSAPSIIVSKTITPVGANLFNVDFVVEAQDISAISYVTLYHNAYGTWQVEFLTPIANTSFYRIKLSDVFGGINLSYFVESADIVHNTGQTSPLWLIVEPSFNELGEEVIFWAENNSQVFSNIRIDQNNSYYFILNGPSDIDLLSTNLMKFNTNDSISPNQTEFVNISSNSCHKFFRFDLTSGNYSIILTIPSESENFTMSFAWIIFNEPNDDVFSGTMTETTRIYGIQWSVTNGTYFSFVHDPDSPLVLRAEVYTSNWTLIASFGVTSNWLTNTNDTFFVIIWTVLRTGDFTFQNSEDSPDVTSDPYYDATTLTSGSYYEGTTSKNASLFPGIIYTIAMLTLLNILRKKREGRNK